MQDQPRYNEKLWLSDLKPEEREIMENRSAEFGRVKCPVWFESRGVLE